MFPSCSDTDLGVGVILFFSQKPTKYSVDFLIAQGIMPESHRQSSITRSLTEKRRTASAPVTPVLTVPPKVPVPSAGPPPVARLGETRSLPSTMHRPQPRRLVTMPPQILEQTTKASLYNVLIPFLREVAYELILFRTRVSPLLHRRAEQLA